METIVACFYYIQIPIADPPDCYKGVGAASMRFMQAYAASLDQLGHNERLVGLRAITLASHLSLAACPVDQ